MLVPADAGVPVITEEVRAVRPPALRRVLAHTQPYLYLVPAMVGVAVWIYWPILRTLRLSTVQWNLLPTTPQRDVGLDNYRDVLALEEMRTAVWNTVKYTVGLLPFSVILPLAIALMLAELTGRSRNVYRVAIFVPVLMAPVVVAVVWRWMLHPTNGVVSDVLATFGMTSPNWFRDETLALWTIVGITGWKLVGFSVLIFAAGIAGLDRDVHDAARMDGATRWQTIRHVTLPLLSPTTMFMVLLTLLLSAQWTFPLVNVLTDGGPLDSTTNVYHLLWKFGFRNFNVGFSSAAAVIFFVAFGAFALVCVRVIDRFSFYDS
ncbi:MAG: sugar ABC transporter permease [Actinomycetota bacterium]|nr:sugar ABC transporter permease [Actinomycetota bacterium]